MWGFEKGLGGMEFFFCVFFWLLACSCVYTEKWWGVGVEGVGGHGWLVGWFFFHIKVIAVPRFD